MKTFQALIDKSVNYLFPLCCINCNTLIQDHLCLCPNCWANLSFIKEAFCHICGRPFSINNTALFYCAKCVINKHYCDQTRVLLHFDQFSKKLIHNFKYYDKGGLASFFANLCVNNYHDFLIQSDVIIPVPMHKLKRIMRLYNQTQLLGQALHNIIKKPLLLNTLIKTKLTKSQSFLPKKERMKNITLNQFAILNKSTIENKTILLIDDVITTSVTINTCAQVLKKNGANKVFALAIACT